MGIEKFHFQFQLIDQTTCCDHGILSAGNVGLGIGEIFSGRNMLNQRSFGIVRQRSKCLDLSDDTSHIIIIIPAEHALVVDLQTKIRGRTHLYAAAVFQFYDKIFFHSNSFCHISITKYTIAYGIYFFQ